MANSNRPMGLSPVKSIVGDAFSGQTNVYQIAAALTTAFAPGDPVVSSGSGDANGVPGIALAAASGPIRGVIVGLGTYENGVFNPAGLDSIIRPAAAQAKDWYALVCDDPNTIFEVQENANGTALAAVDIGMNTILKVGNNNGFLSGWQLASATDATPAVTATLQVRLLGLARKVDNAFGANAKWLVKINSHELSAGTVGL